MNQGDLLKCSFRPIHIQYRNYNILFLVPGICFLDRFEKQINFAKAHPEYSIIGGRHIIFDDNSEINLNQCFSVKVNKRSISYDITEYMKDGKLNLAISINDLDQNVNDVLLRVTSNDKEIYNKSTYVKNYNDLININNQNKVTLDLVIQTKEGDELILFSYVGRGEELNYKITYEIKDEILEQINFELDLSDVSLKHERIYVGGTEVKSLPKKYQMENNNIIWYIAGISSIVLGISFVVYIFVKRLLRRRKGL